ncbi:uncharacterized protein LOC111121918 isoform X4 [Crassostrea virginica]
MEKMPKSSLTTVDNKLKSRSTHQKNRREEQVNKNRNLDPQGAKEKNPRKTLSKDDKKRRKAKGETNQHSFDPVQRSPGQVPCSTVHRDGILADSKKVKTPDGKSTGIHTIPCALKQTNQKAKHGPSSDVSATNLTKMKAKKRYAVQMKAADKMLPSQNDMEKSKKKKALKAKFPVGKSTSSTSSTSSMQTCMGKERNVEQGVSQENLLKTPTTVTFVTFDLETTDLIRGFDVPHITQIGAYELNSEEDFSEYVIPKKPLSPYAAMITSIQMRGSNQMYVKGRPVAALNIRKALNRFMKWLGRFPNPVLIAHNGRGFDFKVLRSAVKNINKTENLDRRVCGYIDSIEVFRKTYPNQKSYKQEALVASILNITYEAHSAHGDARVLGQLMEHANLSKKQLMQDSFTY